jgi:hypothetical protein
VQQAANAFRKKQEKAKKNQLNAIKAVEKDAVDAAKQLAKDLAIANKPVRKALAKKRTFATNIAKTVSKIVLIRQKLAFKLRLKAKKIL